MIFEFVVAQTHTPLCRDNTQREVTELDFIHSFRKQTVCARCLGNIEVIMVIC